MKKEKLKETLKINDLTEQKDHCPQQLMLEIKNSLENHYQTKAIIEKGNPEVSMENNYEILGYSGDEVTLSEKYTRYTSPTTLLRTHMTSTIPPLLKNYAQEPQGLTVYTCSSLLPLSAIDPSFEQHLPKPLWMQGLNHQNQTQNHTNTFEMTVYHLRRMVVL